MKLRTTEGPRHFLQRSASCGIKPHLKSCLDDTLGRLRYCTQLPLDLGPDAPIMLRKLPEAQFMRSQNIGTSRVPHYRAAFQK